MVVDGRDELNFRKMAILQVDGFDNFNVEALRFGEMNLIRVFEMDSSNESVGKERYTSRDSSVRIEEVGWKFEDKVLAKDCIGDQITARRVDSLMDNVVDPGIDKSVSMAEKPSHGEQCTCGFLAIVDAIDRRW